MSSLEKRLREAASETPVPARAAQNLGRLFSVAPEFVEAHENSIGTIANLFAHSQFLSDYCISDPPRLSEALGMLRLPVRREDILRRARDAGESLPENQQTSLYKHHALTMLRDLKRYFLLVLTLRDLTGMVDVQESMAELSTLAEAIISLALEASETLTRKRYGLVMQSSFCVIGLGKLGAGELNYSSDIDIMTVYRKGDGSSTGILNPYGIRHNRISSHEYFCALTEALSGLLQTATPDGIAYRVDLRLRPNGQKGALSMELAACHSYYEAWGKTWERLALIRARPVAGDRDLGDAFRRTIEPFVWKRSMDFNDIDEIRSLKKRIDTICDVNDIKRGYGGIREIEFFVQTFQLLYGGEKRNLRSGYVVTVLDTLHRENFISPEEARILSEAYLFLRRLEHFLQMKDDMQTHTLPANPDDARIVARKMGYSTEQDFLAHLKVTRVQVRDMYTTLLGGSDAPLEIFASDLADLPDDALIDYLRFKGFSRPAEALRDVRSLREQMVTGKTLRERNLLRKAAAAFLDQVMNAARKDRALGHLAALLNTIGHHESYIDLFIRRKDVRGAVIEVFSSSSYFSRILLNTENLEGIFEYPDMRSDLPALRNRLSALTPSSADSLRTVRETKSLEELKCGMLFLTGHLDAYSFARRLTALADTLIRAIVSLVGAENDLAVIGLGGYGARDLHIGSDLDLLFVCSGDESRRSGSRKTVDTAAGEIIRYLSEYTEEGYAYKIDMRLRPDGQRGILVHPIEGYDAYYRSSAQMWEIQSLLRARPVAGNPKLLARFLLLRRQVIRERGREASGRGVMEMRKRITSGISKEASGYDLKNGPGGVKEIEFLTQYYQMKHAADRQDLIVHDTLTALKRLSKYAILEGKKADFLLQSHGFLTSVDTLLRCNDEDVVRADPELLTVICRFLRIPSPDQLMERIEDTRRNVREIAREEYEAGDGTGWRY